MALNLPWRWERYDKSINKGDVNSLTCWKTGFLLLFPSDAIYCPPCNKAILLKDVSNLSHTVDLPIDVKSGVTNHWTGLLDNIGLDYWTDIFWVFTHSEVGFIDSCYQGPSEN